MEEHAHTVVKFVHDEADRKPCQLSFALLAANSLGAPEKTNASRGTSGSRCEALGAVPPLSLVEAIAFFRALGSLVPAESREQSLTIYMRRA